MRCYSLVSLDVMAFVCVEIGTKLEGLLCVSLDFEARVIECCNSQFLSVTDMNLSVIW